MVEVCFNGNSNRPADGILVFLQMLYVSLVIASIVLFTTLAQINLLGFQLKISGSVIPYVALYSVSFIILKIYGYKSVNQTIACMMIASLLFIIICHTVVNLQTPASSNQQLQLAESTYQMYFAGFIALPLGMYSSFLALALLNKIGLSFGVISLSLATVIGETINTIVVFPIGFHGVYSIETIFQEIITNTLIFKFIAGIILAIITNLVIKLLAKRYES